MSKRVLDAGNCAFDHGAIRRLIEGVFQAEVVRSRTRQETLQALGQGAFDLVLVNRLMAGDGSDGLALIREIKSTPEWAGAPIMLITNFADRQRAAVAAGAEPGFGKRDLSDPATLDLLAKFLR